MSDDAAAIAALYRQVYPAPSGGQPGDGYPFPQFMSARWLAEVLAAQDVLWLVAETPLEMVGCFGAMRDIGFPGNGDHVAEMTGLIVHDEWRLRGVANQLMGVLCRELESEACFIIAEARTANPGGWKAARNFGFTVIGFEPFAHSMLGQLESMVVMARVPKHSASNRWVAYETSRSARSLAELCAEGLPLPGTTAAAAALPVRFRSWHELRPFLSDRGTEPGQAERIGALAEPPRLVEQRGTAPTLARRRIDAGCHNSGIVALRRLRGYDSIGERYAERHYLAVSGSETLGAAQVSVDRADLRARILYLDTACHGLQGILLGEIVDATARDFELDGLTTIVVDVRADMPELHASLEAIGFGPTVYYPSLIAGQHGRIDAVQFTRVLPEGLRIEAGARSKLDAPGLELMERVLSLAVGRGLRQELQGKSQSSSPRRGRPAAS